MDERKKGDLEDGWMDGCKKKGKRRRKIKAHRIYIEEGIPHRAELKLFRLAQRSSKPRAVIAWA
jgi:hypothetical protein